MRQDLFDQRRRSYRQGSQWRHWVLESGVPASRAAKIDGENVTILSAGTDGIDGNSPAAGRDRGRKHYGTREVTAAST